MRRQAIIIIAAVIALPILVGIGYAATYGPNWCAKHPRSTSHGCVPVTTATTTTTVPPTTTTTTVPPTTTTTTTTNTTTTTVPLTTTTTVPTLTGCVVVFTTSPGVIQYEGNCADAAAWASLQGGRELVIYPYTGPACDPNVTRCYR